jgi:hypothetical protein
MSRYRRLKIEGAAVFFTLALADRGSDPLIRFGERARGALGRLRPSLTGYGAEADRKDRTRPAKPLLILS